jgi:uncharacterized protein (TIGR02268 family)
VSHPTLWLALCLLVASAATAQPQPPARERQDRRTALARTPTELRVAANTVTTVMLNGPLDRDSLVVDKTRFKWAEVSDQFLILQPFTDLGPGERLVAKVNYKDRALPAQAAFVVITHPTEVDGTVEVERRANSPEALSAALAAKDAQLEELKARCEPSGPIAAVRSGAIGKGAILRVDKLKSTVLAADGGILTVVDVVGYEGQAWAVIDLQLHNPHGQKSLALGAPVVIGVDGKPIHVRAVWMEKPRLGPGEQGRLMVETHVPPWAAGGAFRLELTESESAARFSIRLQK